MIHRSPPPLSKFTLFKALRGGITLTLLLIHFSASLLTGLYSPIYIFPGERVTVSSDPIYTIVRLTLLPHLAYTYSLFTYSHFYHYSQIYIILSYILPSVHLFFIHIFTFLSVFTDLYNLIISVSIYSIYKGYTKNPSC